jgi:CheY-like chemotaxis protein
MMKLLLVDDDAFLRDMYATKFIESGHEVAVAGSAATALQTIEEQDFDVVLLDMIMPGLTGVELIQTIKEQFPKKKIACIVLSNHGQESDIEDAKQAGAEGYIVKAEMIPSDVVKEVEKLTSE